MVVVVVGVVVVGVVLVVVVVGVVVVGVVLVVVVVGVVVVGVVVVGVVVVGVVVVGVVVVGVVVVIVGVVLVDEVADTSNWQMKCFTSEQGASYQVRSEVLAITQSLFFLPLGSPECQLVHDKVSPDDQSPHSDCSFFFNPNQMS